MRLLEGGARGENGGVKQTQQYGGGVARRRRLQTAIFGVGGRALLTAHPPGMMAGRMARRVDPAGIRPSLPAHPSA